LGHDPLFADLCFTLQMRAHTQEDVIRYWSIPTNIEIKTVLADIKTDNNLFYIKSNNSLFDITQWWAVADTSQFGGGECDIDLQ